MDPLAADYPHLTPYNYAGNKPIGDYDIDGMQGTGDEHSPPKPTTEGQGEGQTKTTSITSSAHLHGISTTHTETWYWHNGGVNGSQKGWMSTSDYYDDVLKPLAEDYQKWKDSKDQLKNHPLLQDFLVKNDVSWFSAISDIAKDRKENPKVEGWQAYVPIWGSGKQAYLDYSVGKGGWGTFNTLLAVSDVFLLKSLGQGLVKGGFKALGKNYMTWSGWSGMYNKAGAFTKEAGDIHHWLLEKGWFKKDSFGWWFANQRFNLEKMTGEYFINGSLHNATVIHQAFHGNSKILKLGIGQQLFWRAYFTPNWVKLGFFNGLGHADQKIKE